MTWCVVIIPLLLQSALATFPPVSNPPPIPNQGVRTVDISGQRFYVQDDLQINPPQTGIIKEESYPPPLPTDPKVDDQRWFVYENQSGETSDFPSSTETFDRYYSNGLPAVGPVATPVPDDAYVAQPSGTSKVIPENSNVGSSDIWVLTKGPDDQYVPQRWVQVQMPQERISQVVNADVLPQIVPGSVKSLAPQPLQPIKTSGPPVAPSNIQQQVWVRVAPQVESQKVDIQQQPIKQYVQMDVVQDQQVSIPLSPPNVVSSKSSNFVLPPPPPPPFKGGALTSSQQTVQVGQSVIYKGSDLPSPKQTVILNQPANYKGVDITSSNQAVLVNQPENYKGVDMVSTNQAVLVNQPVNYKGVDIDSPNQSILVNQPVNYKGVDVTSPKQTVIVNQSGYKGVDVTSPNQAVIVNQPINYKGVDITPSNQAVIVNQPATYKGADLASVNQAVLINQQANYKGGDVSSPKQVAVVSQPQINVPLARNVLTQVKHIWIPTSQRTGKFITVPVGRVVDSGKSIPSKGIQVDAAQPISVSGTWILKQDGSLPRFEPQRTISTQVVQKGTPLVPGTVLQFDSPKNPPLLGKSVDSKVPVDVWANSKDFSNPNLVSKSIAPPSPFPIPAGKSGSVVVGKSGQVFNISPQKTYIASDKGQPLQPLPAPVPPPILQGTKGKPCLIGPPKSPISAKAVPYPVYRSAVTVNRQSFPRILRLNRFPYGSYYVLNPRVGQRMYAYPRPQVPVVQQTKNGLVRIIPSKQVGVPQRQMYIAVPRKQVALPAPQLKSLSPILQPQFAFPSVQAVNRIRYAYPRGSYLRTLPAAGKNVFIFPPGKKTRQEILQSSSSESSSSESSSSESKSEENKPNSKEETGEAKSEASPESVESKSERETEDVEAAASEPEPESKEASEAKSEETEAPAESQEASDSEANSAS